MTASDRLARHVLLLAGGNHRAALAFARSLARCHCRTWLAAPSNSSTALHSRFVEDWLPVPDPLADPDAYLDAVGAAVTRHAIGLVLPIDDPALGLVAEGRPRLPQRVKVAAPAADAVRTLLNKSASLALAQRAGVPTPPSLECRETGTVLRWADTVGYPLVAKLPDPDRRPEQRQRMQVLPDAGSVATFLQQLALAPEELPIFQGFVRGEHRNVCCFVAGGEVLAMHEYVSLRRQARVGILREVRLPDPRLADYSRRLLGALRLDGLALVQFIASGSATWFLEINARPWASIQGSVNAGWDFPRWCYDYFTCGTRPTVPALRIGSRTRDHGADLDALLGYLGGGASPTPNATPSRLRAVCDYLSGFAPSVGSDTFSLRDPLPALIELRRQARSWLTRIQRPTS